MLNAELAIFCPEEMTQSRHGGARRAQVPRLAIFFFLAAATRSRTKHTRRWRLDLHGAYVATLVLRSGGPGPRGGGAGKAAVESHTGSCDGPRVAAAQRRFWRRGGERESREGGWRIGFGGMGSNG